MPITLTTRDAGFEAAFGALLGAKRESAAEVDDAVAAIIAAVAERGDAAPVEYTNRFDRVALSPAPLPLSPGEIAPPAGRAAPDTGAPLPLAGGRVASVHPRPLPSRP